MEVAHMIKFRPVHIFIVLLLILSSWVQAAGQYSRVYVFGDSLSDTGNLASIIGTFPDPLPDPFYMNRVSNGPVAVDILADRLGLKVDASLYLIGLDEGTNYAVAGANAFGDEVIDLGYQVLAFQANHGHVAPADALYVMMIGGNDVRSARDDPEWDSAKNTVRAAVAQVKQAIIALAQSGARSFLVVNSANIGIVPETHLLAASLNEPKLIKRSRRLSQIYRVALHKAMRDLSHSSDLKIIEFDLFKFFNKLVRQADRYGITNTTDACFNRATFIFHIDCNFGLNFDQFFFFDDLHPTARIHSLLGEALYRALIHKSKRRDRHHK
jgi:phospholipase/lecithinase/hemolysin